MQSGFGTTTAPGKTRGMNCQAKFLPAREVRRSRMMALQNAQLLAQHQDFKILLLLTM